VSTASGQANRSPGLETARRRVWPSRTPSARPLPVSSVCLLSLLVSDHVFLRDGFCSDRLGQPASFFAYHGVPGPASCGPGDVAVLVPPIPTHERVQTWKMSETLPALADDYSCQAAKRTVRGLSAVAKHATSAASCDLSQSSLGNKSTSGEGCSLTPTPLSETPDQQPSSRRALLVPSLKAAVSSVASPVPRGAI
jgi:hypothetical protein